MDSDVYIINGVKVALQSPDLDGDGVTGEVERIQSSMMDSGRTEILQPTEIGEAMKELNKDDINPKDRFSDIDMRSRLHYIEEGSLTAMQSLVAFRFLPITILSFTRSKMRLSVSRDGKGRGEMVSLYQGKKEMDKESKSMMDNAKQWFMGK